MKRMVISAKSGKSVIAVGESLDRLHEYCGSAPKGVIVTDRTVRRLHGHLFPPLPVVEIGAGEKIKTMDTIERIYGKFLEAGLDRSSWVIGIGGGIVCDMAGFAASTYLRGLNFGFVPTTLLAQVDASVGGKNGVNYRGYKNLIGVFRQPSFVLCDFALLKTLPPEEIANGYAEVIKHALIGDASLFSYLESSRQKALAFDDAVVGKIVHDSLIVKKGIVSLDEMEGGERRKLNFGHTFGHAMEKCAELRHGEAISVGMVLAAKMSEVRGMLTGDDTARIGALLRDFALPTTIPVDRAAVIDAIGKDKKRMGDRIHFVLLEAIGRAKVVPLKIEELEEALDDLCRRG